MNKEELILKLKQSNISKNRYSIDNGIQADSFF